jgi:hypothetical protein
MVGWLATGRRLRMRNRSVRTVGLLAATLLLVGVAGCGDDTPTLPFDEAGSPMPVDEPVTTPPVMPGGPTGDLAAWCATFDEVEDWLDEQDVAFSPEEFQELASAILPVWARLMVNVPAEVREPVATIAGQYQRVADGDVDAVMEDQYFEAYWEIDDFVFANC